MATLTDVGATTGQRLGEIRRRRLVRRRPPARPRLWFELTLLASFYWLYSLIRNAVPEHEGAAQAHAHTLWTVENNLGIAIEETVNHAVNSVTWLVVGMNYYYATLHFIVTLTVLVWLYRSHPGRFTVLRTVLLIATGIALIVFYLYPLAPPRLMDEGHFIDTVQAHHTWGSLSSPSMAGASNQYAAMPSMHFGWSAWCGAAIALSAQRRWVKILGLLYPLATLSVIVATGNHFVFDAVGGGLAIAAAAAIALLVYFRLQHPQGWPSLPSSRSRARR